MFVLLSVSLFISLSCVGRYCPCSRKKMWCNSYFWLANKLEDKVVFFLAEITILCLNISTTLFICWAPSLYCRAENTMKIPINPIQESYIASLKSTIHSAQQFLRSLASEKINLDALTNKHYFYWISYTNFLFIVLK